MPKESKPQRPSTSPGTKKPPRPVQPATEPKSTDIKKKTPRSTSKKPTRPVAKEKIKDQAANEPSIDLLGSIEESVTQPSRPAANVVVEQAEVYNTQPSNLDLLMGAADGDELDTGFEGQ